MGKFMDYVWMGNPISRWLIALAIFLAVIVALWPLKKMIVRRLRQMAKATDTELDNLILEVVGRTKRLFVFLIALWAGSRVLSMPPLLFETFKKIAILVVVLQVGIWATTALMEWLKIVRDRSAREGQVLTWLGGVEWAGKFVIWTLVLLIGMENLGLDVTGLVTGLGIGGIAVALAAQNILSDLFAAFSIYIDGPFVIGDYLKVGDQMGTVESIGMKTTRLRSLSGEQLIFGNSDLVGSRIQNFGRLTERRAEFQVGVTYNTPREKVARIPDMIREIVEAQDQVRFDRSHFKEFSDSALVFDTVYFVLVPAFAFKMDVQQTINLELMQRFEKEGIEFAFPSQTIYLEAADSTLRSSG
jgi:small-conductance mechanosensitive channel